MISCGEHFRGTGSVQGTNGFGRTTVLSDVILDNIYEYFIRCPWTLLIELSLNSRLSYGNVLHKATKILKSYTYRVFMHVMYEFGSVLEDLDL